MSQDAVEAASGVKQAQISRLELGQASNPGVRDLVRLAEFYEIDLERLTEPFRTRQPRRRLQPVAS